MPKIVSNTTPIISLLKLNRLQLFQELYDQIYIPTAVYNEIEAGKTKKFYKDLAIIEWINIVDSTFGIQKRGDIIQCNPLLFM
jgi:predicted nucleic acid-binding protein